MTCKTVEEIIFEDVNIGIWYWIKVRFKLPLGELIWHIESIIRDSTFLKYFTGENLILNQFAKKSDWFGCSLIIKHGKSYKGKLNNEKEEKKFVMPCLLFPVCCMWGLSMCKADNVQETRLARVQGPGSLLADKIDLVSGQN